MSANTRQMTDQARLLRMLAAEGDPGRRDNRLALSLLLESQARIEARLDDLANRLEVAAAQRRV